MARKTAAPRKSRKAALPLNVADDNDTVALALSELPTPRRGRKPKGIANTTETALDRAEIAERLEAATKTAGRFDREKAVALAEANGLRLNPALDNGRTAMTTRNWLRARALKGERVVWG